ncbi:hypothetical protein ACHAWF_010734 [Thalassiosira exigua]
MIQPAAACNNDHDACFRSESGEILAAILAAAIYLILAAAALLSTVSSTLQSLSSHGKTRTSYHDPKNSHETTGIFGVVRNFLLTGLTVNKCRFIDFYAVGIVMTLLLVCKSLVYDACTETNTRDDYHYWDGVFMPNSHRWMPTILLLTHLSRRYCECKWIQRSRSSSRMHLAGYLLGILHYLCLSFILMPHAPSLCRNGENDNPPLSTDIHGIDAKLELTFDPLSSAINHKYTLVDITAMVGCIYFQYEQHRYHIILANLRKKNISKTYSIPYGGWFNYVSCPHYLAEIMIYFTFFILSNELSPNTGDKFLEAYLGSKLCWIDKSETCLSLLITMFRKRCLILLAWVAINLSISASTTHSWYLKNFGLQYPRSRQRLVPFVW